MARNRVKRQLRFQVDARSQLSAVVEQGNQPDCA
jgi:hypothetical protein